MPLVKPLHFAPLLTTRPIEACVVSLVVGCLVVSFHRESNRRLLVLKTQRKRELEQKVVSLEMSSSTLIGMLKNEKQN